MYCVSPFAFINEQNIELTHCQMTTSFQTTYKVKMNLIFFTIFSIGLFTIAPSALGSDDVTDNLRDRFCDEPSRADQQEKCTTYCMELDGTRGYCFERPQTRNICICGDENIGRFMLMLQSFH